MASGHSEEKLTPCSDPQMRSTSRRQSVVIVVIASTLFMLLGFLANFLVLHQLYGLINATDSRVGSLEMKLHDQQEQIKELSTREFGLDELKRLKRQAEDEDTNSMYDDWLNDLSLGQLLGSGGLGGASGLPGAPGAKGDQGLPGRDGIQGRPGNPGLPGAAGAVGATGPTGATGATGPVGPEGEKGSEGSIGVQGAQGELGLAGPRGSPGSDCTSCASNSTQNFTLSAHYMEILTEIQSDINELQEMVGHLNSNINQSSGSSEPQLEVTQPSDSPRDGDVRIDGRRTPPVGSTSLRGALEVYMNGSWGYVCDDVPHTHDLLIRNLIWHATGQVACTNLGAELGQVSIRHQLPNENFALDDLLCAGSEQSLLECSYNSPWNHNCDSTEGIEVECTFTNSSSTNPALSSLKVILDQRFRSILRLLEALHESLEGSLNVIQPNLTYLNETVNSTQANVELLASGLLILDNRVSAVERILRDNAQVVASTSAPPTTVESQAPTPRPLAAGSVRIGGRRRPTPGESSLSGLVEVYIGNGWGYVCDDLDGINNPEFYLIARFGHVVCRELGGTFASGSHSTYIGSAAYVLDDVRCTGTESDLSRCAHSTRHNCGRAEGLTINCTFSQAHVNTLPSSSAGVVYNYWGKTGCDAEAVTLYQGAAMTSTATGGGAICVPTDLDLADFSSNPPHLDRTRSAAELKYLQIEFTGRGEVILPCTSCYRPNKSIKIIQPGSSTCPSSWTLEYAGYLLDANSDMVCVKGVNYITGGTSSADVTLRTVCPRYGLWNNRYQNQWLRCVVCSK